MILKLKIWILIYFIKLFKGFGKISTNVIYGQAYHETGGFKSSIFKENYNLFGMREAKIRKNYALGTKRGHAYFKSHFYSILDYFERQANFKINSREDSYFMDETVKSGYAEDINYLKKWENTIEYVKKKDLRVFNLTFFFALLTIIWIFYNLKKQK